MGQQHQVSFRQYVEDDFHCPRCKTMGRARYLAKGTGAWAREGVFGDADSAQEQSAHSAAMALSRDAEIVKSYLKCPGCHMRAPNAFMWTRVGIVLLLALGAACVFGIGTYNAKIAAGGAAVLAIYLAGRALGRRSRADHATFSMVEKGELPAPDAKTKAKTPPRRAPLPKATLAAGTAPKVAAAPAPVIPVRTSAPEIVTARDAGDGPAFLK